MDLMTPALWQHLPPLDSQQGSSHPLVYCHFFLPDTQWDWYVLEYDGSEVFYGWVNHVTQEFSTFYLSELRIIRGLQGRPVARDVHFTPRPLWQVQQRHDSSLKESAAPTSLLLQTTLRPHDQTSCQRISPLQSVYQEPHV